MAAMKVLFGLSMLLAVAPVAEAQDKTITKVVKLLQTMLEKSKVEGDEERKIYAKFKCYCDMSEKEKTASIDKNTKLISLLENEIDELQGGNGEASSKSAELKASMEQNEVDQETATAIRGKENTAFKASKTDLEDAIKQLNQAITTLGEVGADQTASTGADNKQFMAGKSSLISLQSNMQSALSAAMVFMNEKQHQEVTSFIQAPFTGTYTSQSGAIMGILKNMRDTFQANLAAAIKTEGEQLESYDELIKVKKAQHEEMSGLYEDAQSTLGANDGELSAKRSQLSNAEGEKADDEEFMEKLKPMCKAKGKSYEERKMLRANEEVAVAEAISILNSDDAFSTFSGAAATSTGATSFLQTVQKHFPGVSDEDVRQVMQRLLRRAAAKTGSKAPRLARITGMLQAENPFDKVLDEIEKMLVTIKEEAKADTEKKEWCEKERKENKDDLKEKNAEVLRLEGEIDRLTTRIHDPVKGLKAQIEETEKGLEENHDGQVTETADRKEKNVAYQADIKNLVNAEALLENALKVLKAYYDKFAFVQTKEEPAPPATWEQGGKNDGYKGNSEGGNSAITMLEFILKETKTEESEAHADEEKDQASYEDSMTALKKEEADKEKSLAELQSNLAKAEEDLLGTEEDLKATTKDKNAIEDYLQKIKPGCDFIQDNYDLRVSHRAAEKTGLETARDTLKASPAYKEAVANATVEGFGKCKDLCANEDGTENAGKAGHVKCKACMAGVSIPGYCAGEGHAATPGCK